MFMKNKIFLKLALTNSVDQDEAAHLDLQSSDWFRFI